LDITGVAPNVELFAVKVLNNAGSGNLQDILEGLDWAVSNGMNIINLSLGSTEYSPLFEQMINEANNKGVLIVAASGNDGIDKPVKYPAKFNQVIAVSAVNQSLTISQFSQIGNEIDFAAPGENILSTYNLGNYEYKSGTSQSTAHVTGMFALLKEKYPNIPNSELKSLLGRNAWDLGDIGQDPYYGSGLIYYNSDISTQVKPSISYSTHIQMDGWTSSVLNGKTSGTVGQAKRLEAIKIELKNAPYSGGIEYSTHVQDYGWLNAVSNGKMSGTSGQSKRLEAIQIHLTGQMAQHYDIYYRIHTEGYGWLDWATNGEYAGTQGLGKRLEAIQILLTEKGDPAPGASTNPFVIQSLVHYSTHVQDYGWLNPESNGKISGTVGEAKRMEAIKIALSETPYLGGISYTTHVQDYGWLKHVSNGALSGTSGQSKRLEAIQIYLTGELAQHYDIYYRVHAESFGWLDWAKNGQSAGTEGLAKRLEAIQILLVEKNINSPGSIDTPFIKS
jgi:uncharacterized protein YjdB